MRLCQVSVTQRRLLARRILSRGARLFVASLKTAHVLSVDVVSLPPQDTHGIYIANHPTIIDVLILVSQRSQLCCIAKEALYHHFLFGPLIRAAGYIHYSNTTEVLSRAVSELKRGQPLLIFPEGTRSQSEKVGRFKRGAARLALETNLPLYPMVISCNKQALIRSNGWLEFSQERCKLSVDSIGVVSPHEVVGGGHEQSISLASRVLTTHLEGLYGKYFVSLSS
jgi:1-acyl-sn-glycerol-3-phosphate acyltransferase